MKMTQLLAILFAIATFSAGQIQAQESQAKQQPPKSGMHNMQNGMMSDMMKNKDSMRQMCQQMAQNPEMMQMMCEEMMKNPEGMRIMCEEMMKSPEGMAMCEQMMKSHAKSKPSGQDRPNKS